ncbi:MAG: ATP-binding protein [Nitrospirota bacterium]|nr:ATP-binding protein [Nitrospirota bacterium]MDH5585462.1 ATP-binding protein [Nitrospirota bacterium]MDH5773340.1 ATP-binding protein [Nitrospirota bacterium]
MSTIKDHLPTPPDAPSANPIEGSQRFLSLRAKFSLFVSLVIILVCTGLSGFLIQQEIRVMKRSLLNTGTFLVNTLNKISLNRLIIQDTDYLGKMLEGALSAPEVVYAVVRDQQGNIVVSQSKGLLTNASKIIRDARQPLLPDNTHTTSLLTQSSSALSSGQPLITVLHTVNSEKAISLTASDRVPTSRSWSVSQETIYDFALPVYRSARTSTMIDFLMPETLTQSPATPQSSAAIIGIIQVGLSTTHMQNALYQTVWNIGLLTIGIILLGIGLTVFLTNRIITPMRKLATAAQQIAEGNIQVSVVAETQDEVGQLTHSINQMATSLQQREKAITTYMNTITKHVTQLSTLHQTGAAITSTLDVHKLFGTVLKLLRENLGFQRMVLVLKDASKTKGVLMEISGVPEELEQQLKGFEFSIAPKTFDETLLIHGKPILVPDLEAISRKMNPDILELGRQFGMVSFVSAPLISHMEVLGYLGADKGQTRCTQEDLDLLVTITNHVAVAIDNARTYQDLEVLAQSLEERVLSRTKDLQVANERLQELDRLKSAFVSIVSHELRTPMTSIKGLVENMMDGLTGTLNERQSFYLDRVKHNIERLTRMINDLLDLSRIEAGKMDLLASPVNVGSLAREVVELLQPMAQERRLTLHTEIVDPLPLIHADRDKLIQILTNLITNGIKFTEPSGTVTVHVHQQDDGAVTTCIQDTGSGIPFEEQQTIFERFYRGQTADVKARGAGLGLAITKSLVELHGGQIWVTSTPGKGSQFCFNIPAQPPATSESAHEKLSSEF